MRRNTNFFLFSTTLLVCIGLMHLTGCGGSSSGSDAPLDLSGSLLWSVGTLSAQMADPNLIVLDCRKDIADSTGAIYTPYDLEHIEGAHYIDFFVFGDPYPDDVLQTQVDIEDTLSALGITVDSKICLYDTAVANPQGKVFFQLERQGCTNVHILDGGIPAWKVANGAVSSTPTPTPTPSVFVKDIDDTIMAKLPQMKTIWDDVQANPGTTQYSMIDYREDPLYYGHKICPDAARTGYMPGAKLLNWRNYFDSTTGLLKPIATLDALTQAAGGGRDRINVLICNKGWRTGMAYFVLRYVGYPKSKLIHYVGGFREWSGEDYSTYPTTTESCFRPGKNMHKTGEKPAKTDKRFAGASAQVGKNLYCIGGYQVSTTTPPVAVSDVNQAFDMDKLTPLDNQWTNLEALPAPRAFSVGAAVNGKVFVFGGLDASGTKQKTSYMYNIGTDSWGSIADMPAEHFSFAAAAVESTRKIYCFGGLTGDGALPASYSDALYEYDEAIDTWTTVAKTSPWPHGRRCHAMVTIGTILYLIGGFYKEGSPTVSYDLNDIWTIDTANLAGGWTQKSTTLTARAAGHSAAVVNGKIYIPGWWSIAGIKYDVIEYDPVADTTCDCEKNTRAAQIGWPRYWYFIGAYGNEFVTIGGFGGGPGNIATTDHSGFMHFHQPYVYDVTLPD